MLERAVQPAQVEALSGGDAGKGKAVGQQLAGVEHFSAPGGQNSVTALGLRRHPLEILLTAVELELHLEGIEALGLQISDQTLTKLQRGGAATQQQRT